MNWYRPLALLGLVLVAAACAGGRSASTADTLVRARGVIVTVGGPAPGAPRPIAGAEFELVRGGSPVAVRADRHGRFVVAVAPGTYRVRITGHAPESDGRPIQPQPGVIDVGPGGTRIRLVVNIR